MEILNAPALQILQRGYRICAGGVYKLGAFIQHILYIHSPMALSCPVLA
jgi:hypothetical protein